jgi:hypothetical protein
MAVTESAREHLFATISQQYEPEDAETLKALLMSPTLDDLATKQDLERFATKQDLERFATKQDLERFATKQDLAEFKADLYQTMHQQTRTYVSWMFGLLTAYTAVAGSIAGIVALVIR